MLKYAVVALTSLIALQMMNADGVIVEDNTPTVLSAGGSKDVTVSIHKGNVDGFAKLELDLPVGLSAEAVSTSGASFTFSGQKAKFIWMAVPEQEEFSVTYSLKAAENATGDLMIQGVFAYIKDQQRVDYELKNKLISIQSTDVEIAEDSSVEAITDPSTDEPEAQDGTTIGTNQANDLAATDTDSIDDVVTYEGEDMECLRYVEQVSSTEYTVRLEVVNNLLEGFCKLSETMPSGCVAEELDSDGAVVTLEPNGIKFVWFDAPQSDRFEVTYSVRRFAGGSAPEITGAFSYIKNNAPYDQPIISLGLTAAGDALADRPNTTAVDTSDEVSELSDGAGAGMETDQNSGDTDNTSPVQTDRGSTSTADVEQELPENSVTSFPDPELGITYKVQIAAAHRTVGKSYFIGRHGFMEQFNIENDEGWVKYTTGKHQVYKNARDARDRIRTNYPTFKGPFVTAYSDGDRITVQEALMISNQQWYK